MDAMQVDHNEHHGEVEEEEGGGGGGEERYQGVNGRANMEKVDMNAGCVVNGKGNSVVERRMGSMETGECRVSSGGHVEEGKEDQDEHRRIQEELAVVLASRDADTVKVMVRCGNA